MDTTITSKKFYHSLVNISLIFLLIVGVLFLSSSPLNSSKSLFTFQSNQCPHPTKTISKIQNDELEEVLERASMGDNKKTVIIAVVNKAYVMPTNNNMLDIFLESFWVGEGTRELVNHLMIVAVDQTAYDRCVFRGLHCFRLITDGVDFMGEKVFMSDDFIKMMWRRTLFLLEVLKKGYSFIFTDTDVVWLRNPFTILTTNNTTQDLDIQFSTDIYNGNTSSNLNPINTGFYFVKSNQKTVSLFEKWYELKDNSTGLKEQDVLQNLTRQGVLSELGLKARFLDTRFFSGFCEDSFDIQAVITVHANCCRFINAKVSDLTRVLNDWSQFRLGSSNKTTMLQWSSHEECLKSWQTNNGTSNSIP